jgi:hypothetical protein
MVKIDLRVSDVWRLAALVAASWRPRLLEPRWNSGAHACDMCRSAMMSGTGLVQIIRIFHT